MENELDKIEALLRIATMDLEKLRTSISKEPWVEVENEEDDEEDVSDEDEEEIKMRVCSRKPVHKVIKRTNKDYHYWMVEVCLGDKRRQKYFKRKADAQKFISDNRN